MFSCRLLKHKTYCQRVSYLELDLINKYSQYIKSKYSEKEVTTNSWSNIMQYSQLFSSYISGIWENNPPIKNFTTNTMPSFHMYLIVMPLYFSCISSSLLLHFHWIFLLFSLVFAAFPLYFQSISPVYSLNCHCISPLFIFLNILSYFCCSFKIFPLYLHCTFLVFHLYKQRISSVFFFAFLLFFYLKKSIKKKIPHTGGSNSLDRCG